MQDLTNLNIKNLVDLNKQKFLDLSKRQSSIEKVLLYLNQPNQQNKEILQDEQNLIPDQLVEQHPVLDKYILENECGVCLMISKNPVECLQCKHRFCLECANNIEISSQPCPYKCQGPFIFQNLDFRLKNQLYEAKFKCHIGQCTQENEYLEAVKHTRTCQYIEVPCSQKCNEMIQFRNVELHQLQDCKNSKFLCTQCNQIVLFNQLTNIEQETIKNNQKKDLNKKKEIQKKLEQSDELKKENTRKEEENINLKKQLEAAFSEIEDLKQQLEASLPSKKQKQNGNNQNNQIIQIQANKKINQELNFSKILKELQFNQSKEEIQKHFGKETNFDGKVFEIKKEKLEKGKLKKIQKKAWETFENSDGVFFVIKTDKEKEIAAVIPSKFQNTQGMEFKVNGLKYINRKQIPDLLYFYWLDDKIITCKWQNSENAIMMSHDQYFLLINGLGLSNNRQKKDFAYLNEIQFEGMEIHEGYPGKTQEIMDNDYVYWKKGDKLNYSCVSGAENKYFEAESIEVYGLKFN